MKDILLVDTDAKGVRTLTLNRPERRNALDETLIGELLRELLQAEEDAAVRVVVITGAGASFCAGADLQWLHDHARDAVDLLEQAAHHIGELMAAVQQLRKPSIARVNGPARAGGAGLVCCCDIAVAVGHADFAFTEVRLGLLPAVIAPYVDAAIGSRHGRRYLLSGETLDSRQALAIGLVHEVVAAEALDATVRSVADALLLGGPHAQAETKRLLAKLAVGEQLSVADRCRLLTRLAVSEEGREGIAAFLEKRKPRWQP